MYILTQINKNMTSFSCEKPSEWDTNVRLRRHIYILLWDKYNGLKRCAKNHLCISMGLRPWVESYLPKYMVLKII